MITDTQRYKTSRANWEIDDPGASGAISVRQSGYVPLVTAAAESRTVDDPHKPGLDLTLQMKTDGGDCTVTFDTAFTEAGDTTIVFSDAGQLARFYSIESGTAYVWRRYAADPTEAATITTLTSTTATINTINAGAVNGESFTIDVSGGTAGVNFTSRGSVTQITSITTGVSVEGLAGVITTVSSTLAAGSTIEFTVTNTEVAANDVVLCSCTSASAGSPVANVTHTAAGSFVVALQNVHDTAALDNTVDVNFVVFKTAA